MKNFTKKILALLLSLTLFVAPVAFAQDVPTDAASTTDTVASSSVTDTSTPDTANDAASSTVEATLPADAATTSQGVDPQDAATTVQDTTNTQAAVTGDVLESTTNPESASSSDVTSVPIIIDNSATTPVSQPVDAQTATDTGTDVATPIDESSSSLDVVAQNIDTTPAPDASVADTPAPVVADKLVALPIADLAPQPAFSFALTGKHISAKRKVQDKNGKVTGEEVVAASLTPTLDNTTGAVNVAGQCSAKEFVVLLFKNPNDYIDDPRSYIVNRAYPCVNGAFSYSITDLPPTLPNGNYYLLVGQQGDTGAWTPITSITEVTINKNQ